MQHTAEKQQRIYSRIIIAIFLNAVSREAPKEIIFSKQYSLHYVTEPSHTYLAQNLSLRKIQYFKCYNYCLVTIPINKYYNTLAPSL